MTTFQLVKGDGKILPFLLAFFDKTQGVGVFGRDHSIYQVFFLENQCVLLMILRDFPKIISVLFGSQ